MPKRKRNPAQETTEWKVPGPRLSGWCMKHLPPGDHEECQVKLCTCTCHKEGETDG